MAEEYGKYLEGERIYLREVRPSDVNENYYRWMNDPEITQYLESRFYPNALESIQDFVKGKLGDRESAFFAIVLKDSDRHIGNIKIGPVNWIHRIADIGLMIGDKASWGKGYATEAIRLVTEYGFKTLNLHKITASCYASNQGSAKAFVKVGFFEEGVRKSHSFSYGKYEDVILLGIINPAHADSIEKR